MGPLQLTIDSKPLIGLDSGKARALLCYLAVNGRIHSRQALAGLLWGELPEADARRNLRGVILKLRQLLDPYLHVTHQTVAFNQEADFWLDTAAFRTALSAGVNDGGALQTAVQLYRGEFLQEFYIRQAPEFEAWLQEQRTWFHNQAVTVHDQWGNYLLKQARYD